MTRLGYYFIILPTILLTFILLLDEWIPFPNIFHSQKWILLVCFVWMSYTSKKITDYGYAYNRIKFFNYYVLSMIVRVILTILILSGFMYLKTKNLHWLAGNFLFFYFFYLLFEIYYLLTNLRTNSK